MESRFRFLHLEDNQHDAELIRSKLSGDGLEFDIIHVSNREDFISAIHTDHFDLILCDYNLPAFDGMRALRIALQECPGVPFIFASGTIGEDLAIEALKMGATDYVLKDRLERLNPAVRRALAEADEKKSRKQLEEQLLQMQKMESIGTLAGGIAHDFNNILAIIMGYTGMLEEISPDSEIHSENIDAVMQACRRGTQLVQQLLTFARKKDPAFESVSVNDIVSELAAILQQTLPKTVTVALEKEEDITFIKADSNQLHQVLLNICLNARDAMTGGGNLILRTRTESGEAVSKKFFTAEPSRYVVVSISDDGAGMTEEVRKHIFEPFFTTKEKNKGTGLGLAVAFGIMQSHQGFIDVESSPGEGTTFSLYFPKGYSRHEMETRMPDDATEAVGGTETILLVEHEEMLRDLEQFVLGREGYTIHTAADGNSAVSAYEHHASEISLVMCDYNLPLANGIDVFKRLKMINDDVKFILTCGFIEPNVRSEILKAGVKDVIIKPCTLRETMKRIRAVLDYVP